MWLPLARIRIRFLVVASISFFSALGSVAPAVTIDDFSVGQIEVSRTGTMAATALQVGLDPDHVQGGSRDISVGEFGGVVQTLVVDTAASELRFSTSSTGYFQITYGSAAAPL